MSRNVDNNNVKMISRYDVINYVTQTVLLDFYFIVRLQTIKISTIYRWLLHFLTVWIRKLSYSENGDVQAY